jgi:hyperosmotically inducible periplasmic protein
MPTTTRCRGQCSVAAGLAIVALGVTIMLRPATAKAQTAADSTSVRQENLSAQSTTEHHYASPADRASDALLIVRVMAAIADKGLADDYPLTVDADHGRVTLTGVLASQTNVERAAALVAGIDGVTGVNNRLTWDKAAQ